MHTNQQAVSVGRLQSVLGELADQLGHSQFIVATDVVQHSQGMILPTFTYLQHVVALGAVNRTG